MGEIEELAKCQPLNGAKEENRISAAANGYSSRSEIEGAPKGGRTENFSDDSAQHVHAIDYSKDSATLPGHAEDDYKLPVMLELFMKLTLLCLKLVSSKYFHNFITFVIILASVMVGMQTYPSLENDSALYTADKVVLYIFTAEVVLKVLSVGLQPWQYIFDAGGINFWNVFDFLVVLVCYLPLDASMVTVIRLFRLLRVLKLVKTLPELQILVMGLLGSVHSIFYVALLLCLVYYLYGIMCLSFFQTNDPVNFHDLQTTFLTLFRMSTLDDWTDLTYMQMYGNDVVACDSYRAERCTTPTRQPWFASIFFVSFTILSAYVIFNLFIGVVAQQMDEAKDRLTKENENRGNMVGCEDEFDEDERSARLIYLRYADLIDECHAVEEDARQIMEQLTVIQKRLMYSTQKFECHDGSGRGAWEAENPLTDESPAPSPVVSIRDSSMLFVDSNKVSETDYNTDPPGVVKPDFADPMQTQSPNIERAVQWHEDNLARDGSHGLLSGPETRQP